MKLGNYLPAIVLIGFLAAGCSSLVQAQKDDSVNRIIWQGWTTDDLNYSRLTNEEITKSVRNSFNII